MANDQQTVEEVLKEKFENILRNSNLKSFLQSPCSGALESIFDKNIDIWLSHHSPVKKDSCFFGIPFEYHIVGLIGQSKLWKIIAWRGDKFIDQPKSERKDSKTFPESNCYADVLYECDKNDDATGFCIGNRIAIECKWTEYDGKSEDSSAVERIKKTGNGKYQSYFKNALKDGACAFYLALGVGWDNEKSAPIAVYLVPASAMKGITAKKIKSYRLNGTPIFNKEESLLSKYFHEETEKEDMAKIIISMQEHIDSLADDLGLSE